jgi:hypothetical protein
LCGGGREVPSVLKFSFESFGGTARMQHKVDPRTTFTHARMNIKATTASHVEESLRCVVDELAAALRAVAKQHELCATGVLHIVI